MGQRKMKNIQVSDGATNCAFSVYQISEECFHSIFPGERQNIEFIDDLILRLGEQRAGEILTPVWKNRVEKEDIIGLHGTLFFEMKFKKKYYPNKRESDLDDPDLQKYYLKIMKALEQAECHRRRLQRSVFKSDPIEKLSSV